MLRWTMRSVENEGRQCVHMGVRTEEGWCVCMSVGGGGRQMVCALGGGDSGWVGGDGGGMVKMGGW